MLKKINIYLFFVCISDLLFFTVLLFFIYTIYLLYLFILFYVFKNIDFAKVLFFYLKKEKQPEKFNC